MALVVRKNVEKKLYKHYETTIVSNIQPHEMLYCFENNSRSGNPQQRYPFDETNRKMCRANALSMSCMPLLLTLVALLY